MQGAAGDVFWRRGDAEQRAGRHVSSSETTSARPAQIDRERGAAPGPRPARLSRSCRFRLRRRWALVPRRAARATPWSECGRGPRTSARTRTRTPSSSLQPLDGNSLHPCIALAVLADWVSASKFVPASDRKRTVFKMIKHPTLTRRRSTLPSTHASSSRQPPRSHCTGTGPAIHYIGREHGGRSVRGSQLPSRLHAPSGARQKLLLLLLAPGGWHRGVSCGKGRQTAALRALAIRRVTTVGCRQPSIGQRGAHASCALSGERTPGGGLHLVIGVKVI